MTTNEPNRGTERAKAGLSKVLSEPATFTVLVVLLFPAVLAFGVFWFPSHIGFALAIVGGVIVAAAIFVLWLSKPLPRLSEQSALFHRLDWLGRFLVAGSVLFVGIGVSQSVSDLPPAEAVTVLAEASKWLVPFGFGIVGFLLLFDLFRLGSGRRQDIVLAGLETLAPAVPSRSRAIASVVVSGISNPLLCAGAALVLWFVTASQVAGSTTS